MGRQKVADQQAGHAGGGNITSDPAFLRQDQCRQMANYRLSVFGAALKRLGTAMTTFSPITTFHSTNSTSSSVVYGRYWPLQSRAYISGAATNSTTLHLYRSPYSFPLEASWSDLGACPQWRSVVFSDGSNEALYLAGDTTAKVRKVASDGTTISALGAGTKECVGLCVYNDRLWGWNGNTLYYSELSSLIGGTGGDSIGDTSAGGGSIIVRTFGASNIVACAAVNGSLLIFQQTGISVLTGWGQDDIQVLPQALNATIGMGSATPEGICVANEEGAGDTAYFVTSVGMFVTNGGYVRPMSTPDKPDPIASLLLGKIISIASLNVAFNPRYNEVWVAAQGYGVWCYNVVLQAWSGPFVGTYATSGPQVLFPIPDGSGNVYLWRVMTDPSPLTGLYVAESDSDIGQGTPIYKDDMLPTGGTTWAGGQAVVGTLQYHRMFAGDRLHAKTFRWVNILATLVSGGAAPIAVCTTQVGGSTTHTLATPTSVEQPYYISPGGDGPYLDVTITDSISTGSSQYVMATVEGYYLGQR